MLSKIKKHIKYNLKNPYAKAEDKFECIFIHVPKTAGTSIAESLFGDYDPYMGHWGHKRIIHYFVYDRTKFKKYFKFAFVRNPWDRFYSAYNYLAKMKGNISDRKFARKYFDFKSFKDFTYSLKRNNRKTKKILNFSHFLPQSYYLTDNNDKILLDKICYFENIQNDFEEIKSILEIEAKLKEKRKVKHKKYTEVYNEKMIKIVQKIYKKDIEFFGYSFNN